MIKKLKRVATLLALVLLGLTFLGTGCQAMNKNEKEKEKKESSIVVIKTNLGNITIALFQKEAPETCSNFLKYVDEGHYNHTIFHRVIDGFMVQTGGVNTQYVLKPTHAPIRCESNNGLTNLRGTVAMARTSDPHSASSQFFINVADNHFLDYRSSTPSGFGYCVFGKVINGIDVIDKIKSVKTTTQKGWSDIPIQPIEIYEVSPAPIVD